MRRGLQTSCSVSPRLSARRPRALQARALLCGDSMKKHRRTLAQVLSVALLLSAAACSEETPSPSDSQSKLSNIPHDGAQDPAFQLDGRSFVLRSVEGDQALASASATLEFVRGELRFFGACN